MRVVLRVVCGAWLGCVGALGAVKVGEYEGWLGLPVFVGTMAAFMVMNWLGRGRAADAAKPPGSSADLGDWSDS